MAIQPATVTHDSSVSSNLAESALNNSSFLSNRNDSSLHRSSLEGAPLNYASRSGATPELIVDTEISNLSTQEASYAHEMALLSESAYSSSGAPEGYTRIDGSAFGLTMEDPNTGFYSTLFQNDDTGDIYLAFRGTETDMGFKDWITNFQQGFSGNLPEAYEQAKAVTEGAQDLFQDQLAGLTGDSLGGGLATYAGLSTGLNAMCFNTAGLSDSTLELLGDKVDQNAHKINNYNVCHNWLSDLDGNRDSDTIGGTQVGNIRWLEGKGMKWWNPLGSLLANHSISTVVSELNALT